MLRELERGYIILDENGIIQNIAMFTSPEDANCVARCVYGDAARAEEYRWLVGIGDVCRDGIYYVIGDDGAETPAEYIPTEQESISQLQAENQELKTANDELTIALADLIGGAE